MSSAVALAFIAIGMLPGDSNDVFYQKGKKALLFMPTISPIAEQIGKLFEEDKKKARKRTRKRTRTKE